MTNSIELQKKDSWLEVGQLGMLLRILVLMTNRLPTFDDFLTENLFRFRQIVTIYFNSESRENYWWMSLSNHHIYLLKLSLLYVVRNLCWNILQMIRLFVTKSQICQVNLSFPSHLFSWQWKLSKATIDIVCCCLVLTTI